MILELKSYCEHISLIHDTELQTLFYIHMKLLRTHISQKITFSFGFVDLDLIYKVKEF